MKYERLTKRFEVGLGLTKTSCTIGEDYITIINRLAELEDKIEAGTLVELPCKVGDTVWFNCPDNMTIKYGEISKIFIDIRNQEIQRTYKVRYRIDNNLLDYVTYLISQEHIFTTKEEAEARLKEMMEEQHND